MDPNEDGMVFEEIINTVDDQKRCVDCKTTKMPLWRSGPSGPKSLCNACGIRYRKKRVCTTTEDLNKDQEEKKNKKKHQKETSQKRRRLSENLRRRVIALSKKVVLLQRPRSPVKRQRKRSDHNWKKMAEVEQAAVLLVAMSCGSIFA